MSKKKKNNDKHFRRIYKFIKPFCKLVAKRKYGIKAKPVKVGKPMIVLCNHNTDTDFTVVSSLLSDHMYVVMSEHVLEKRFLGKIIKKLTNPIPVYKGSIKTTQVMEIVRRIKNGNSILLFPEGRLSHNGFTCDIEPSVSKLVKLCKCELVTVRINGGFFKQPRWQLYQNKGKVFSAGIVNRYDALSIENMSVEQLQEHIEKDLYVDTYADQMKFMKPFKLIHGIEGVQRFYTVCPKCGKIESLSVKKNDITCKNCGFTMTYNKFGFFENNECHIKTIPDWEKVQNATFDSLLSSTDTVFNDGNVLFTYPDGKRKKRKKIVDIKGYSDRIEFDGKTFLFKELDGADILIGGSQLLFSKDNVHYTLFKKDTCLNKYYYAYKKCVSKA